MSAVGRILPVVTVHEYCGRATYYSGLTGQVRPGADLKLKSIPIMFAESYKSNGLSMARVACVRDHSVLLGLITAFFPRRTGGLGDEGRVVPLKPNEVQGEIERCTVCIISENRRTPTRCELILTGATHSTIPNGACV